MAEAWANQGLEGQEMNQQLNPQVPSRGEAMKPEPQQPQRVVVKEGFI